MDGDSLHLGQRRFESALRGLGSFVFQRLLQVVDLHRRQNPLANQPRPHSGNRIAHRVRLAFCG